MADIENLKKKHAFENVEEFDIVKTDTHYSPAFKKKRDELLARLRKVQTPTAD